MKEKGLLLLAVFCAISACASNPRLNSVPQEEKPPEPVSISVYPLNSVGGPFGATVWIDYRIAPNPDNRSYIIEWEDEAGPWGGQGKSLDGANEPYTFPRIFVERLTSGVYKVVLKVSRIERGKTKIYRAEKTFIVH